MSSQLEVQPHGIHVIDTGFVRPGLAASYLMVQDGRAAFIETGTRHSVPALLAALQAQDLDVGDVDLVAVTHVHLDHAGGAGALMAALPNATLVVHPRGARHLVDPSKLVAGSLAVYGAEVFAQNYGEVVPVPAARVVEAPDGHVVELAGRPLRLLDTPGHARHHACIQDEASRGVFTGDTFGLAYRELDSARGAFAFPTTSPVQFEPEAMHASVDRLVGLEPDRMYLTHFGPVGDVERIAADLHRLIDGSVEIARRHAQASDRHQAIAGDLLAMLLEAVRAHGSPLSDDAAGALLAMDVELNTQGLEVWLSRQG